MMDSDRDYAERRKKAMHLKLRLFINLLLLGLVLPVQAQNTETRVPDLNGLSVPEAAAELNRAGLRLGTQTSIGWTPDSGLPQNVINGQSVAPGMSTGLGTVVDVTLLRSPNIGLIYDDNDFTMINRLDEPTVVTGLVFNALEGTSASFAASRWTDNLREQQCLQIWSVNRNGPKEVEGCRFIQTWRTTTNPAEHFWTQTSGVQRFSVTENGVERAICNAAPRNSQDTPTTCEFFLAGGSAAADVVSFVYFAYTPEVIALVNSSENRWMATEDTQIYNYNPNIMVPGSGLRFGDPDLYGNPDIVADITQLAPGQCLVMTNDNANAQPPEACDVIAQLDLSSNVAFWLADFELQSTSDNQRRNCPAAAEGRLTVCIMPR